MHRNHKKITVALFVMTLLLTSCSNTGKVSPKEDVPENVQADDGYQSDFFNGMVAGSPEGYYFCEQMNSGYVSFFDKNSKQIVPLCGKADCSHNSLNCDAYFPNETFGVLNVQYENGYLYRIGRSETDEDEWVLYRISKDGSVRENLMGIATSVSVDGKSAAHDFPFYLIKGGYFYYSHATTEDNETFTATLYRVQLKKNAEPEVLWEGSGYNSFIDDIRGIGNQVYFEMASFEGADFTKGQMEVFCYNEDTGEITSVVKEKNMFTLTDENTMICFNGEATVAYDIGTGEETKIIDQFCGPVHFDGTYLYLDEWAGLFDVDGKSPFEKRKIKVYDLNYNLVDEIAVPGSGSFYGGDADYLFVTFTNEEDLPEIRAFDKSQIGAGEQEWVPLPSR